MQAILVYGVTLGLHCSSLAVITGVLFCLLSRLCKSPPHLVLICTLFGTAIIAKNSELLTQSVNNHAKLTTLAFNIDPFSKGYFWWFLTDTNLTDIRLETCATQWIGITFYVTITYDVLQNQILEFNKTGRSILNANYPQKWVSFAWLFTFQTCAKLFLKYRHFSNLRVH